MLRYGLTTKPVWELHNASVSPPETRYELEYYMCWLEFGHERLLRYTVSGTLADFREFH